MARSGSGIADQRVILCPVAALNLNPHPHSLLPDGLFVPTANGSLSFESHPSPSTDELQQLLERLVRRFRKLAHRFLDPAESPDGLDEEQQRIYNCAGEALRLPFSGAAQGHRWTEPGPKALCACLDGFSLHAARTVATHHRAGLEHLCRYGLRAPYALDRFSATN